MLSRMEHDSIGALNVPAEAYYGVQSMRAATNFQITHRPLHPVLIDSIVMVKKAAAITNEKSGKLDQQIAQAIIKACDEILDGNLRDQFIVDAIQGGAGTSANMNANEVIANRAIEIFGGTKGDYSIVHPNDHVNMSQSTNDVIPTAGKITVLKLLPQTIKELEKLEKAMEEKEAEFDDILKMGRTQLWMPFNGSTKFWSICACKKGYQKTKKCYGRDESLKHRSNSHWNSDQCRPLPSLKHFMAITKLQEFH